MYFLPTFFEFFENKRLFASKRLFRTGGRVFSRHNLWYTVSVFVPDMVRCGMFTGKTRSKRRFSSFLPGFFASGGNQAYSSKFLWSSFESNS